MIEQIKQRLSEFDLSTLGAAALALVPDLIAALVVLTVFFLVYRATRRPMASVLRRTGMHDKLIDLLVHAIYKYALMITGVIMAASQIGINVGAALAGLGVAGIAVGFAAQDSLANVISGITIFLDTPFVVGDWITVEDEFGKVTDITLRSTRIRTPRNSYVVIPNKQIIDAVLENHSKHGRLRVDVAVGIAYKETIAEARDVILAAVSALDVVLDRPSPDVVAAGLGSSSVDLTVRVWIASAEQRQATTFAVVEACKVALDAAGIEIPFPHLQLFLEDVRPPVWDGAARLAAARQPGT